MLFQRRKPADWREKLRIWLWPRRSWARSGKYVAKRVLRLTASPHAIAAGVAAGVFASFTPFMGFHFLIAFMVAYVIAGNFLAAAMGTFFGNPLTFPFIWGSTFATGQFIIHGPLHIEPDHPGEAMDPVSAIRAFADLEFMSAGFSGLWSKIAGLWEPLFLPMMIGAVPIGIGVGIIAYISTRWASGVFRRTRAAVITEKARSIKQAAEKRARDKADQALLKNNNSGKVR